MKTQYDHKLRDKIQPLVDMFCRFNKADPKIIDTRTRKREVVYSRQMVYYYLHQHAKYTTSEAAAIFNQDHATFLSGSKNISDLIETDKKFKLFDSDNNKKIKSFVENIDNPDVYAEVFSDLIKELEIQLYHGCI